MVVAVLVARDADQVHLVRAGPGDGVGGEVGVGQHGAEKGALSVKVVVGK